MEKEFIVKQVDKMMGKTQFAEERVELAKKIILICLENDWIDLETTDTKSFLNKLANYILYCPLKNEKPKDEQKVVLLDYNDFKKIMKFEEPTENILYIMYKEKNYKLSTNQVITKEDLMSYNLIRELQNFIHFLRYSDEERQFSVKHMSLIKEDQKLIKNSILRPIEFKRLTPTSSKYEFNEKDLKTPKAVREMLRMLKPEGEPYNLQYNLECILFDCARAIEKLELNFEQLEILESYISGDDVADIAKKLGHYYNHVEREIWSACKKIAKIM